MRIVTSSAKAVTKYRIMIQKLADKREKNEYKSVTIYDDEEIFDIAEIEKTISTALMEYSKTHWKKKGVRHDTIPQT